jgi:hypothetical protein
MCKNKLIHQSDALLIEPITSLFIRGSSARRYLSQPRENAGFQMLTKSRSLRRDYPAMFGIAVIMLGIFMIGGIAYTYSNRPSQPSDATSQALEDHRLPADL